MPSWGAPHPLLQAAETRQDIAMVRFAFKSDKSTYRSVPVRPVLFRGSGLVVLKACRACMLPLKRVRKAKSINDSWGGERPVESALQSNEK